MRTLAAAAVASLLALTGCTPAPTTPTATARPTTTTVTRWVTTHPTITVTPTITVPPTPLPSVTLASDGAEVVSTWEVAEVWQEGRTWRLNVYDERPSGSVWMNVTIGDYWGPGRLAEIVPGDRITITRARR